MEKGISDGYITDYILHIEYFSQGNKLNKEPYNKLFENEILK